MQPHLQNLTGLQLKPPTNLLRHHKPAATLQPRLETNSLSQRHHKSPHHKKPQKTTKQDTPRQKNTRETTIPNPKPKNQPKTQTNKKDRGDSTTEHKKLYSVVFTLIILAMALLLSMPRPNRVVAFTPYLSANGSLHSSTVTSLRISIMPATCVLIA